MSIKKGAASLSGFQHIQAFLFVMVISLLVCYPLIYPPFCTGTTGNNLKDLTKATYQQVVHSQKDVVPAEAPAEANQNTIVNAGISNASRQQEVQNVDGSTADWSVQGNFSSGGYVFHLSALKSQTGLYGTTDGLFAGVYGHLERGSVLVVYLEEPDLTKGVFLSPNIGGRHILPFRCSTVYALGNSTFYKYSWTGLEWRSEVSNSSNITYFDNSSFANSSQGTAVFECVIPFTASELSYLSNLSKSGGGCGISAVLILQQSFTNSSIIASAPPHPEAKDKQHAVLYAALELNITSGTLTEQVLNPPFNIVTGYGQDFSRALQIRWQTGLLEEAYLIYSKTQTALDNLSWTCVSNAIQQSTTQGYYAINASGNTTLSEGRYVYHAIINDLQPDTGYYFRIILPNSTSRILRARTLPNAGNATLNHPLEFIRAGDSQKYEKQIAVVWDAMSRFASVKDLYFILFTGDFTDDGDIVENWDVFFTLAEPVLSRMCLVPVLGNHEDNSTNYYTMLPHSGNGRFFSFRGGKCLIAVVDTSESFSEGSEQYVWLLSELENAREDYIFLATHRPPVASWLSSKDRQATADLLPIIDRYCVDLVMAGHKHLYERTLPYRNGSVSDTGTVYVISGGAGAKLDSIEKADFSAYLTNNYNFVHVLVDCGQVTSTGISISLVPFDSITINRVHGWRENADDKTGGTPVLRVYIYYFAAVLLLVISASTIAYAWSTREH